MTYRQKRSRHATVGFHRSGMLFGCLVSAVVLLLSACGGDDDQAGDPSLESAETTGGSEAEPGDEDADPDTSDEASVETSGVDTEGSDAEATDALDGDTSVDTTTADLDTADEAANENAERPEVAESRARVLAFAEEAGVATVVAVLSDDTALILNDGNAVDMAIDGSYSIWSDGSFVYRRVPGPGGDDVHTASLPDGTVVCEAEVPIHHATQGDDGGYVMAIEYVPVDVEEPVGEGETAYAMDAADCDTGERQTIEPVTFDGGEGQYRFIERIADRVFTGYGDAEGNADILNERAISINGEDYAGYHVFNADASIVTYGDMGAGAGPHRSPVVMVRDTVSGDRLSTTEFDRSFQSLHFIGDRLLVTFFKDEAAMIDSDRMTGDAVILDPQTGDELATLDVGFELVYAG